MEAARVLGRKKMREGSGGGGQGLAEMGGQLHKGEGELGGGRLGLRGD
jgi:hypothetical protein